MTFPVLEETEMMISLLEQFCFTVITISEIITLHDTLHCVGRENDIECDTLTSASAANHHISDGSDTTHATVDSQIQIFHRFLDTVSKVQDD